MDGSRFRAFLFLTALVFAVITAVAYLHGGSLAGKITAVPSGPVAIVTKPAALDNSAIPAAWREDSGVPVLCYHQIVTEEKYRERPTPYAVTVRQFREQMEFLAEKNFYTISPDELLAYVQGQKQLDFSRGRPIVLTFDDGNNDFVDHAQKILDQHKFKGVLFIYPTYIFARKPRSLSWAQIKAVLKAGHAIESHAMWHPRLNEMSDAEQRAQFADSMRILNEKAGAGVKHLAYPFGLYNSASLKLLRETGYASAHTTFYGGNQVGEDPYLLRRYLVVKSDNADVFAQKTLARSLPLRHVSHAPGAVIGGETALQLLLPPGLDPKGLRVRIFSTAQRFTYAPKTGELTVEAVPAKKRLSVLEIVYKENGIEYRANALLNHKRGAAAEDTAPKRKSKKGKKKKKRRKTED